MTDLGALPAVDHAALPPDVRAAGRDEQRLYEAALGFERMLLAQLLEPLADGAESGDAAGGAYKDLVPQTLADSVASQGGIGIARQLYDALEADR